jgi:NAD(P)H-hydrate repair Nnr-like enzyme with NAD(P)H-hydrate dehydratase domain
MSGAAYLCAKAAYRTGAGLVEIFTHECNRIALQTSLPEAIVTTYTDEYDQNTLLCSLERADAVVVGCGLGVTQLSRTILSDLLHVLDGRNVPLIIYRSGDARGVEREVSIEALAPTLAYMLGVERPWASTEPALGEFREKID